MNNIKVYVDVIAQFNSEGVLIPLSLNLGGRRKV